MMMKSQLPKMKSRTMLSLAVAAIAGGAHLPTQAGDDFFIEEVIVTAQKRAESLQDVSVSVSAVSADFMQDAGITDMVDVSQHVPALTVSTNSSPWNTSFRMRRIGNEGNIPTFEADTGLFIDGSFRSRSGLGLGDLVDIERVEVLKGPQSTLYGKNVTAGVISVTTAAPTQNFDAMVEATAAQNSAHNVKGYINGGLSDTVSGRLSFSYSERDHLMENVASGGDADDLESLALRGQLLIEPSDELSIRLIAGAVERDFDALVGDVEWGPAGQAIFSALGAPISDNEMGNRKFDYPDGVSEFEQDSYEFSAVVNYDLGGMTLASITSYDEYDVGTHYKDLDQAPLDFAQFEDTQDGYSWSQELRLTSDGGETIDWMTGLFVYHNNFTRGDGTKQDFLLTDDINLLGVAAFTNMLLPLVAADPANPTPAEVAAAQAMASNGLGQPGEAGDFYNEQDTDTYGIFASATWNLSEDLSVTGGLRYSYEKKEAKLTSNGNGTGLGFGGLPNGIIGALAPEGNLWEPSDDWDQVTGNVSMEYHWTSDVMTYATVAHGFKAGGYNLGFGTAPNEGRPFGEEKVDTLELGWKSQLLDNRLQFNGAVFYTEYTDFQSAAFLGLQFNVNNAEQVNNMGIEFDALYLLTENLTVNLAASYVKAEYDEYTQGSCAFGVAPHGPAAASGFCDLSGEDLPFAPRWKANAGIQYEQALGNGDFYARTDISWVGDHTPSSSLDVRHEQSDYAVANAKLGWRNDHWDFSVWGKNITNQDYAVQYAPDNILGAVFGDGSQQAFMNTPASAGATVRYIY